MQSMTKKKTSISIDDKLWKDWVLHVVKKTGSSYKVSEETEQLIKKELKDHPL